MSFHADEYSALGAAHRGHRGRSREPPSDEVALDALKSAGCDVVVHVGDAVALGPYPDEVVSLLVESEVLCVMGNHDEWAAFGLPEPPPPWLREARSRISVGRVGSSLTPTATP